MNDVPEGWDRFFWDRWISRDSRWWDAWFIGTAFVPAIIVFGIVMLVMR